MKKLLCILLTFVLILSLGSACFAESIKIVAYGEESSQLTASGNSSDSNLVTSVEEAVPLADALPKTGGIPAEAFYAIGALLIVGALVISRIKPKVTSKS